MRSIPTAWDRISGCRRWATTIWLTDEQRVDRDKAVFFQGEWDITSQWSLNGGLRYFQYDNSLEGFYGYGNGHFGGRSRAGHLLCAGLHAVRSVHRPRQDGLRQRHRAEGERHVQDRSEKLVYATYSKGFRPGGVNRTAVADIGPYRRIS